jgi:hypothetical protein
MDQICCLLGLCCPPAQRQQRVVETLVSWGCDADCASDVAKNMIKALDDSPLGAFLKWATKHGEK